ncbi:helix-turn-helix transcriptional regulator [Arthrobacter alpinus]|nr:helix-turn-helix transcriptional regulator [Arthrobacter alpinus]
MPKIVHPKDPAWTADLEAAMVAFGNRGHNEIIRYLNEHGPVRRGDIVEAVSASEASVALHLITLEDSGVIIVDTVRGQRHGRAPRYSVDDQRVKELLEGLRDYLLNR